MGGSGTVNGKGVVISSICLCYEYSILSGMATVNTVNGDQWYNDLVDNTFTETAAYAQQYAENNTS